MNAYRCMFGVDTQVVSGGCANGVPVRPTQPQAPFAGTPTASDVEVRDKLIFDQESLLNAYRCMFGVDTQVVSGGYAERAPADSDAPTGAWVSGVNAAGWDFHQHLTGQCGFKPSKYRCCLQP